MSDLGRGGQGRVLGRMNGKDEVEMGDGQGNLARNQEPGQ